MNLKEAIEKVIADGELEAVESVDDYKDFWVFNPPYTLTGAPPAINKKSGEYIDFFFPDHVGKKYTEITSLPA